MWNFTMNPIWFTVAVLATALAMALAAFPTFAEEVPTAPAAASYSPAALQFQQALKLQYEQDYAKKIQEYSAQQQQGQPDPVKFQEYQQQLTQLYQTDYQQKVLEFLEKEKAEAQQALAVAPAPAAVEATPNRPSAPGDGTHGKWGAGLLIVTPLGLENQYDARFKAFGMMGLASYRLSEVQPGVYMYGEAGFGAVLSKLQPAGGFGFNHVTFDFPLRVKILYPLNEKGLIGEAFVGAVLRFFQYNDDPRILNGPMLSNDTGLFHPDIGVGISLPITSGLRGRVLAGLLYFSLGVEMAFGQAQ